MTEEKQKFIELLAESGAVQFGNFTAKSGRKTPFFINTGKLMYGDQLDLVGRIRSRLHRLFRRLGGLLRARAGRQRENKRQREQYAE